MKKQSIGPKATDVLIAYIAEKELMPGDYLPPEPMLVEALGIGRNRLREAVGNLKGLQLLESRQGAGVRICEHSPLDACARILRTFLQFTGKDCQELLLLRRTLELGVIDQAVRLATTPEREKVIDLAEEMAREGQKKKPSFRRFIDLDHTFHKAITAPANNPLLVVLDETLERFFVPVKDWESLGVEEVRPSLQRTIREHRMIATAFMAGQPDLVYSCLRLAFSNYENHS